MSSGGRPPLDTNRRKKPTSADRDFQLEGGSYGSDGNTSDDATQQFLSRDSELRRHRTRLKRAADVLEFARGESVLADIRADSKLSARVKCLRTRVSLEGVDVVATRGRVGLRGVARCRSVWECPVCAHVESSKRADEVRAAVRRFTREPNNGHVYLVTVTVRHGWDGDLGDMRRKLGKAWSRLWTHRVGQLAKERLKTEGTIRALEVTHGSNGWHPHIHCLWFAWRGMTDKECKRVERWLARQWERACKHVGLDAWGAVGVRWENVRDPDGAAGYLAKMGLSDEIARTMDKSGRGGNRTPWEVLADYSDQRNARDADIWNRWCVGIRGARQLFWSKGLKEKYGYVRDEEVKPTQLWPAFGEGCWDSPKRETIAALLELAQRSVSLGVEPPLEQALDLLWGRASRVKHETV